MYFPTKIPLHIPHPALQVNTNHNPQDSHSWDLIFCWSARVCWPFLCLFCIFERCTDSIPESSRSKQARYTVKRVDEVVRHPHLVTKDQFTQVSKKVFNIPAEDFTINIELFLQTFTNVELVRQNWFVSKATSPGRQPRFSDLLSDALPRHHTLFLI